MLLIKLKLLIFITFAFNVYAKGEALSPLSTQPYSFSAEDVNLDIAFMTPRKLTDNDQFPAFESFFTSVLGSLERIELSDSSQLHQEMFGAKLSGNIYDELLSRVYFLSLAKVEDRALLAYVNDDQFWRIIFITNNFPINERPATFVRAMATLVHEAWHLTPANHHGEASSLHVACPKNDLQGRPIKSTITGDSLEGSLACDDRIDGAYSAQIIFLSNLVHFCTYCSVEVKDAARSLRDTIFSRIVSKPVARLLRVDIASMLYSSM